MCEVDSPAKEAVRLDTNLEHIETDEQFKKVLEENDNVMICCGRMGPMCLPVYDVMENIQEKYPNVTFRDMAFDESVGHNIRSLPEVRNCIGLPFTVYFKNGEVIWLQGDHAIAGD